jgi:tetratricopeptide (TPR) repeat protein
VTSRSDLDDSFIRAAFLEAYWRDVDRQTKPNPLQVYLARWPQHSEVIAEEYLALRQQAAAPEDAGNGFIGDFRVIRELGVGGEGVVYLAEDPQLSRQVAVKVPSASGLARGSALTRFASAAALNARLHHPGICPVLRYGLDEVHGPYIAMLFVDGETLSRRIARIHEGGAPSRTIDSILRVIEAVARALHVAHERGVVHGDIKPSNIMITDGRNPVILDFGFARAHRPDAISAGAVREGTPSYMAPEQVRGDTITPSSDIYALGVVLYECLTGRKPFEAKSMDALFEAITSVEPNDPRVLNPAITPELGAVLATAMAKNPAHRYETAAAFADDMKAIRTLVPVRAYPAGLARRLLLWVRRESLFAALVGALILVLLAAGIWQWVNAGKFARLYQLATGQIDTTAAVNAGDLPIARRISIQRQRVEAIEQLVAETGEAGPWQPRMALALKSLGDLLTETGDLEEALRVRSRTLQLLDSMQVTPENRREILNARAIAIIHHGDLAKARGEDLEAERRYLEAHAILLTLAGDPGPKPANTDLVDSHVRLADIAQRIGDEAAVDREARAAHAAVDAVRRLDPQYGDLNRATFMALAFVQIAGANTGDAAQNAKLQKEKLEAASKAAADDPASPELKRLYERAFAETVQQEGDPQAARIALEGQLLTSMARRDSRPENAVNAIDVVCVTMELSGAAARCGDVERASREALNAIAEAVAARASFPRNHEVLIVQASAHRHRASILERRGDFAGARAEFAAEKELVLELVRQFSNLRTHLCAAQVLIRSSDPGLNEPEAGLIHAEKAFELSGNRSTLALDLAADAEQQLGRNEDARSRLDRLLQMLPPNSTPRRRALENARKDLQERAASRRS